MEKRIGAAVIVLNGRTAIKKMNEIISEHSDIVIGRQGIPLQQKPLNVITLVLEGTTDSIGSLTGKLGRLDGLHVKSVLIKNDFLDYGE